MTAEEKKMHKKLAIDCFNTTWDYIDKEDRTDEDKRAMINTAHASLYHWMQVGTPVEFARGEWQVSRVYAVLQMGESAKYHADACIDICIKNNINGFDLAFAYEAAARAYMVLGDESTKMQYLELAVDESENIKEKDDKLYLLDELKGMK